MKGIRDETQPHCRIFTIPPSHFYLHEKNSPKITFITLITAFTILILLLWSGLVQVIDLTKFGLFASYFRNFTANWENRPKIIGRKAKNRVYFLFTAEFRSKITCSMFLGYWEIPRNNWSLKWSYFREENWHFQLNLIHFFLAEGVGNISLFAFFSRCDDGKAKKDKGWHQRVPKKRRKKENRVRSQAGSNLEGKVYKSNALPTGL